METFSTFTWALLGESTGHWWVLYHNGPVMQSVDNYFLANEQDLKQTVTFRHGLGVALYGLSELKTILDTVNQSINQSINQQTAELPVIWP